MHRRIRTFYLVASLFLFLLVVLGGGLHLSPAGALVAAAAGTPLFIHLWNSCIGALSGARARLGEQRLFPGTEHKNDRRAAELRGNSTRQ